MFKQGKHASGWSIGKLRGLRARTRLLMVIGAALALPAATFIGVAESGAATAPLVSMLYTPATIALNGVSTLSVSITNEDTGNTLTSVTFDDPLPADQVVATPANIGGSCGTGIVSANPGEGAWSLNGGTLAKGGTPGDSCTVSVQIVATGPGSTTNPLQVTTRDNGSDDPGNMQSRILMILATPAPNPVVSESYTPSSIALNGNSTLTISITNPDTVNPMTGVNFADTFPTGSIIATPNGASGSCGGGTFTANAGTSAIALTGGTIPPASTCTLSVQVVGSAASSAPNPITVSATDAGAAVSGTATATLTVSGVAGKTPIVTMTYTPPSIPLNGNSTLTINIFNPDTVNPMTSVAFTDLFTNTPLSGTVVATPSGATGSCGAGSSFLHASGQSQISLSGGTLAPSGSCTLTVDVTGVNENVYTNNITVTALDNGGATSGVTSAIITVVGPPVLTLTNFTGATPIPLNAVGAGAITFNIQNTNTTTTLNGVAFTASLPAGLQITGGSAAAPGLLSGSCGPGTPTPTLTPTLTSISLSNAIITPSSFCQFSYSVTGVQAGVWTTVAPNITSIEGGTGPGSSTTTIVDAPPVVTSQSVSASPIALGATVTLSTTVQNPNVTPLANVAFSDTLPSNVLVATPPGVTDSCPTGVVTAAAATSAYAFTIPTLAAGASCTITVQITGVNGAPSPGLIGTIATIPTSTYTLPGDEVDTIITVISVFPSLPATVTQSITGCRAFSESFNDGVPGSSYAVTTGVLPPGLTLDPGTGFMSGTPTTYGGYPITITVTPPAGGTIVKHGYVLNAGLCIIPNNGLITAGHVGQKYSFTLGGSRGTAPYRYQIQAGGLPTGLSLSQAGVISGTPIKAGTYNFEIYIFDSSASPVKTGIAWMTLTIS